VRGCDAQKCHGDAALDECRAGGVKVLGDIEQLFVLSRTLCKMCRRVPTLVPFALVSGGMLAANCPEP
jgi:hypothetical protein